jgi:hypothetical protein
MGFRFTELLDRSIVHCMGRGEFWSRGAFDA